MPATPSWPLWKFSVDHAALCGLTAGLPGIGRHIGLDTNTVTQRVGAEPMRTGKVGAADGATVAGVDVGACVGKCVGTSVGLALGAALGAGDDGGVAGDVVGRYDGKPVGCSFGAYADDVGAGVACVPAAGAGVGVTAVAETGALESVGPTRYGDT